MKDNEVIKDLLAQIEGKLKEVCADGAYHSENWYRSFNPPMPLLHEMKI
jgi:hypothetical protein